MDERQISKRGLLGGMAASVGALLTGCAPASAGAKRESFEVTKTPAEWRRILAPERYAVLREEKTEAPRSSPLNKEQRRGIYACAGCQLPLYRSETKYESGTGWPSFYAPIPGAVRTRQDGVLFLARTEVHCRRCGGHLGHVFDDGPAPTGKRYCMNGDAMTFHVA
jgi:peptide-methionine (R)-S-oxide reductase